MRGVCRREMCGDAAAMNVKYPKNESVWATICDKEGDPAYLITSKQTRDFYFIYEISGSGDIKRLGKSKNPRELEERYVKL